MLFNSNIRLIVEVTALSIMPEYTPEQLQVIHHPRGHAKVSAAAGSGKTATLIARVIELLRRGADARRLRVLMFNRSAREDFQQRLSAALHQHGIATTVSVQTFHSAGYRLLQRLEQEEIVPRRRLLTEQWRIRALARAALENALGQSTSLATLEDEDIDTFLGFIDVVKADIRPVSEVYADAANLLGEALPEHYVAAYQAFEEQCSEQRVRTLNDLVHRPVQELIADQGLAERFRNQLDHLIIDEYQDVNEAQQQLIRCVAGERAEVMVVGDPDQCVYQWRGARPEYIVRRFGEDFSGASEYLLPHTFRFGHAVALLGNHSVAHNRQRDGKLCLAAPGTPQTEVERRRDDDPQLYRSIIAEHLNSGGKLADIAVLVRLYSLGAAAELELLEAGVPFTLEGRESLFQRREVRALLGYLRYAAGRLGERLSDGSPPAELLGEMLMLPLAGLRRSEARDVARGFSPSGLPLGRYLNTIAAELPAWKARRLRQRSSFLSDLSHFHLTDPAVDVLDEVLDGLNIYAAIAQSGGSAEVASDRAMICAALRRFAIEGGWELGDFLERCDELIAKALEWQRQPPADAVCITSIHRAKGLQWPIVVVPGLTEGSFPYLANGANAATLEAERRLFYVAITRAQQRLYLVHPPDRHLEKVIASQGKRRFDLSKAKASRFLAEACPQASVNAAAAIAQGRTPPAGSMTKIVKSYADQLANEIDHAANQ
ncbi:ATP-dependent helicase [Halorhodospira halochloris]|uniref:ATP-dependent helicase n=1 Tax=Halorhodospira halochloris TaxID=1052 RepID=UPI001EE79992|nr:ATP-dependent helicase [Halorhodospira halochloris]